MNVVTKQDIIDQYPNIELSVFRVDIKPDRTDIMYWYTDEKVYIMAEIRYEHSEVELLELVWTEQAIVLTHPDIASITVNVRGCPQTDYWSKAFENIGR